MRPGDDFDEWIKESLEVIGESDGNNGLHYHCVCPYCGGKKFYVNPENGLWNCWSANCGEVGNATKLVMEVEGVPRHRASAIVSGFYESPTATAPQLVELIHQKEEPKPTDERTLPDGFSYLRPGRYPAYLKEREVPFRVAKRYRLGICRTGRYRGRIILPCYVEGDLRFFQARAMRDGVLPKYDSPPWSRGGVMFGWDQVRSRNLAIVEGPFDVLRLASHGIDAVALLGTRLDDESLGLLADRCFDQITLILDPDAESASREIRTRLEDVCGVVNSLRLPDGIDPGDCEPGHVAEIFACS